MLSARLSPYLCHRDESNLISGSEKNMKAVRNSAALTVNAGYVVKCE